ncbi:MAG: SelB C-terminal domain-containing protein, partial [candidate division Zixibacteria bacterium]
IRPGQSGMVSFRPKEPLLALVGDRVVLRLPTPMVTLGGGIVLDHLKRFPRRKDFASLAYLHERTGDNLMALIISELHKSCLVHTDDLLKNADCSREDVKAQTELLLQTDRLGKFGDYLYLVGQMTEVVDSLKKLVVQSLDKQSHLSGLLSDEIVSLSDLPRSTAEVLIDYMLAQKILAKSADRIAPAGRSVELKGAIKEAYNKIIAELDASPYTPPTLTSLADQGKLYQKAIQYILESRQGYKCGATLLFLSGTWQEILKFVVSKLNTDQRLAVPDLRTKFGFTRKYAIPVLEETDRIGLTKRSGDIRLKGEKFESLSADL